MVHDPYAPPPYPRNPMSTLPQRPPALVHSLRAQQQQEQAPTVEAEPDPQPVEPTDRQWVAINLDKLRHLDLKATVAEMFPEMPKDHAEIADKIAEWAQANNPRVAA